MSQPASVKGKEETLKRAKLLEGLYNQFLVSFHCLYGFYRCLTSYHFYIKVSECKEPFIIVFAISFFFGLKRCSDHLVSIFKQPCDVIFIQLYQAIAVLYALGKV